MRGLYAVYRREMRAYIYSPIAYVVVGVFLLLSAVFFFQGLFLQGQAELRELFNGVWTGLLVAIIGPAIAMRLFSEEKTNETIESLMTMPVQDWGVVVGKYLAGVTLFLLAMVGLAVFSIPVAFLGPIDKGASAAGFLGLFLSGATYVALGTMTSSLTRNQIVAFVLAVLVGLVLWLFGKILVFMPAILQPVVGWLSLDEHLQNFARGVVDLRDVLYFLSITAVCLLVSHASLESRRWR